MALNLREAKAIFLKQQEIASADDLKVRGEIIALVKELTGWDDKDADQWMTEENPDLGDGLTPDWFIKSGYSEKLINYIKNV